MVYYPNVLTVYEITPTTLSHRMEFAAPVPYYRTLPVVSYPALAEETDRYPKRSAYHSDAHDQLARSGPGLLSKYLH